MIAIDLEVHDNAFFEDKIINPPWKNWRIVETANVPRRFRENVDPGLQACQVFCVQRLNKPFRTGERL